MNLTCTNCGGNWVEINAAHPSLDDRYPIGHCATCTPWPAPKRNPLNPDEFFQPPRKTVALIQTQLFDRAAFEHRQKVAEARRLAAKLVSKTASSMAPKELEQAREAVVWLIREEK